MLLAPIDERQRRAIFSVFTTTMVKEKLKRKCFGPPHTVYFTATTYDDSLLFCEQKAVKAQLELPKSPNWNNFFWTDGDRVRIMLQ